MWLHQCTIQEDKALSCWPEEAARICPPGLQLCPAQALPYSSQVRTMFKAACGSFAAAPTHLAHGVDNPRPLTEVPKIEPTDLLVMPGIPRSHHHTHRGWDSIAQQRHLLHL